MVTVNLRKQSAEALDIQKRVLEASITPKINRVFKNMATDASNLYKATGSVPSQLLAKNYSPEFLKEIRDAMRKSIKKFGFNLRKSVEKKHGLFFDAENKASWIDLELKQTITIDDADLDPKLNAINNQFLLASTMFIANESEEQNGFVTDTNSKMLEQSTIAAIAAFTVSISDKEDEVARLSSQIITAPSNQERAKITRQIESVNRQIVASNAGKDAIVANNIETNLLKKAQARSELIASQNVGLAESWARQTEAELIEDAALIAASGEEVRVEKEFIAILDSRTRSSHVTADGQVVGVNEDFIIGNERAKYPRSPKLSAKESINCRCISSFTV